MPSPTTPAAGDTRQSVDAEMGAETTDTPESSHGSEKDPEAALEASAAPPAYTLFTTRQRHCIVLLIGTATMFSPLTANIYLPCIPLLQDGYRVSLQLINTTVTAYVLVQSVAPAFFSQPPTPSAAAPSTSPPFPSSSARASAWRSREPTPRSSC